jgi:hypothetical protein
VNTGGYVKLHRQLVNSSVFENPLALKVFIWALLRATYKTRAVRFGGQDITLVPGQFISGRFAGAEACHMPASTFRNQIARLRRLEILDTLSDNKKTIFTVANWTRYQGLADVENSTTDSQWTTGGHKQEGKNERKERGKEGDTQDVANSDRRPETQVFVTFFSDLHEEYRKSPYAVWNGGDHTATERMIATFGLEECKTRAVRYFERRDEWNLDHGFTIRNMAQVVNGLASDGERKTCKLDPHEFAKVIRQQGV